MDRITNLTMTAHLYGLLLSLRELAADGQEARERDADGGEDRLRNAEAKATLDLADFYIDEFAERHRSGSLPEDTSGMYVLDRADYKGRPMHFAERLYEDGLNEMKRCGIEPNIYSVPSRIEGLLFAIQSAVEACENFPMDTDRMTWIRGKLNEVRVEAGLPEVANTADTCRCGYPEDSSMCKVSGHN